MTVFLQPEFLMRADIQSWIKAPKPYRARRGGLSCVDLDKSCFRKGKLYV